MRKAAKDDTPREFLRLMQMQSGKRLKSGLDNGISDKRSKKRKLNVDNEPEKLADPTEDNTIEKAEPLRILPGERMSDFAARVDQAMPLAGVSTTNKGANAKIDGLKEKTTKHNRRLSRMIKQWREEDEKIRDKQQEDEDGRMDEKEEHDLMWSAIPSNSKKRTKGGSNSNTVVIEEDDPWAVLKKKRAGTKQKNLQDVVEAPPVLPKLKGSIFKDVQHSATFQQTNRRAGPWTTRNSSRITA